MELAKARQIADRLVEEMRPFCGRIEIGGSIRRSKPDCKDIEIVAIPGWVTDPNALGDLFAGGLDNQVNALHGWATKQQTAIKWIKAGKPGTEPTTPKPEGKYWRGYLEAEDVKIDLFLCGRFNWGAIFLIRTGSADFSQAVVTHARRIGRRCTGGFFTRDDTPIPTPEERDVFDLLNLDYIEPAARIDARSLRAKR